MGSYRDVLAGLVGGGDAGSDFWRPEKAGKYFLRLYRFERAGVKEPFSTRSIHYAEKGRPPIECAGDNCPVCKSVDQLIATGNEDSVKRAKDMRRNDKTVFVAVLLSDPTKFILWEAPRGASRQVQVCVAKAGGRSGKKFPRRLEEMPEFIAYFDKGLPVVFGPSGMDICLTYDPGAAAQDMYDIDLAFKTPETKVLAFPEDGNVPDPDAVYKRINEARANKK